MADPTILDLANQAFVTNDRARRPRLRVLANGQEVKGAFKAEVVNNNYHSADRFSAEIALSADPAMNYSRFWDGQEVILIDIQMALLPDGVAEGSGTWTSLIQGEVDHMETEAQTHTLRVEGRDLSARLRDAKTQETFANKTASEIATTLANRHGLTPHVTATTTKVGQYYQLEHDKITLANLHRETNEWDLLVYLAQYEGVSSGGFDVYVVGQDLYFGPRQPSDSYPFVINYQPPGASSASPTMNVFSLRMEHSLTLARDVQVTIKSWNSKQKTPFTKVFKAAGAASPHATKGATQNYVLVLPNKTPTEVEQIAQAYLSEITRHERVIDVTMPGELGLTPRHMILLQGTGTSFDQAYYVDQLTRRLDFDSGFEQYVRGKNSSPRSQVSVS